MGLFWKKRGFISLFFFAPFLCLRLLFLGFLFCQIILAQSFTSCPNKSLSFSGWPPKKESDLQRILSRVKDKSKVILKIDIQGYEYKIIDQIVNNFHQINMLLIQFYWINKNEEMFIKSIKAQSFCVFSYRDLVEGINLF